MLGGMKAHPTSTYVTASRRTWEMIRAAYLSGLSAPTVAARFGVSVSGLRKRAQREGWTKRAQADWRGGIQVGPPSPGGPGFGVGGPSATAAPPWAPGPTTAAPPPGLEDLPPDLAALYAVAAPGPPPLPSEAARHALGLAMLALRHGHSAEALRMARAAELIGRLDTVLPDVEPGGGAEAIQARQKAQEDLTFTIAGELAEGLLLGRGPILPAYLERARRWRRNLGLPERYIEVWIGDVEDEKGDADGAENGAEGADAAGASPA